MQHTTYQIFSIFACRMTTFKISMQDGTNFYYEQVSYLTKMSWKVCQKMKLHGSDQFPTVLAMYDQEIDQNLALPSYQRLKTMARRHTDQMMRTRNPNAQMKD